MAVLDSNFWPKNLVASLAILHNTEVHMKKDFLKLVKRHAKQTPKTIGRIVWSAQKCPFDKKSSKIGLRFSDNAM